MIDDHGPVIHDAVPVLVRRGDMPCERVGKRVKLHRAGQGRANLRVKVGIAERVVVLAYGVLVEHVPVLRRERDWAGTILMMLRGRYAHAGQEHCNGT